MVFFPALIYTSNSWVYYLSSELKCCVIDLILHCKVIKVNSLASTGSLPKSLKGVRLIKVTDLGRLWPREQQSSFGDFKRKRKGTRK